MNRRIAASRQGDALPDRVLVADIAHPDGDGTELTVVSTEADWGDLPRAFYVREETAEPEGAIR